MYARGGARPKGEAHAPVSPFHAAIEPSLQSLQTICHASRRSGAPEFVPHLPSRARVRPRERAKERAELAFSRRPGVGFPEETKGIAPPPPLRLQLRWRHFGVAARRKCRRHAADGILFPKGFA